MSEGAAPTTIGASVHGEGAEAPAYLSRQHRRYRHRPTEWLDVADVDRRGLADVLLGAATRDVQRIMLCGPVDRDAIDRLALAEPPAGWEVAPRGHYLATAESATLRWQRDDGAGMVEIVSALAWYGQRDAATCRAAHELLYAELERVWDETLPRLATPAAAGRDLIMRSLPSDAAYPTLSAEDRAWWQSVSTQGRWELCDHGRDTLPELHVWDQRFSYAAHVWELGVGPLECDQGEEIDRARRGLYRITWRVPDGWDHVGLTGVPDADGVRWRWPNRPGEQHTTWVDGSEAQLLGRWGWIEAVHRRALLQRGRPLDTWGRRLVKVRDQLAQRWQHDDPAIVKAAADGARMLLLTSVGALQGRGHTVTRSVPRNQAGDVPEDARDVRVTDGGAIVWSEYRPPAWEAMAHPEWAAQVWARSRVRVLTSRGGVGALHAARSDVVAIHGDALYLAADPAWPTTGRVGELRPIDYAAGPFDPPDSHDGLLSLRGS